MVLGRTRPPYWIGTKGAADRVTLDRAKRLQQAPDPIAAAAAQLLFWSGPLLSPGKATAHLISRYAKRLGAVPSGIPLPAALDALIRADIPPVLAAPLAVLAFNNTTLKDALPPG